MKRSYGVDVTSSRIDGFSGEVVDALSDEILKSRRLAGPVVAANLALETVSVRTNVDAEDPAAALETVLEVLRVGAKRRRVELEVAVAEVWLDDGADADPREVVFGGEVARRLGVSRQRVMQLLDSGRFPKPIATTGRDRVWRWGDISTWARLNERKVGRPRKKSA